MAIAGKKFLALSIITFLFINPSQAANGPAVTVVGTKGPVTLPSDGDAQAAYRMPSSIGWATSSRLDFDFFLGITASTLENTQNDFEDTSTSPGVSFGVFFALGRPSLDAPEEAWSSYRFSNKWDPPHR